MSLSDLLKSTNPKRLVDDMRLFFNQHNYFYNELMGEKITLLYDLYQRVYDERFILETKKLQGIDSKDPAKQKFYELYKFLTEILRSPNPNLKKMRDSIIKDKLKLGFDVLIAKYDFYINGYEEPPFVLDKIFNETILLDDGRVLVRSHKALSIWNPETKRTDIDYPECKNIIRFLKTNNKDIIIITHERLYLFDQSNMMLLPFENVDGRISGTKLNFDNTKIIVKVGGNSLVIWDIKSQKIINTFNIGRTIFIRIIPLPNNEDILLLSPTNFAKLVNYSSGKVIFQGKYDDIAQSVTINEEIKGRLLPYGITAEVLGDGDYWTKLSINGQIVTQGVNILGMEVLENNNILINTETDIQIWNPENKKLLLIRKKDYDEGFEKIIALRNKFLLSYETRVSGSAIWQ